MQASVFMNSLLEHFHSYLFRCCLCVLLKYKCGMKYLQQYLSQSHHFVLQLCMLSYRDAISQQCFMISLYINKVVVEPNHARFFKYSLWATLHYSDRGKSLKQKPYNPQIFKYLPGFFFFFCYKEFTDPYIPATQRNVIPMCCCFN